MSRLLIVVWFTFSVVFAFSAMTGMLFLYTEPSLLKFVIIASVSIIFGSINTYLCMKSKGFKK